MNRQKALDKPYALLALCGTCHMERIHGETNWPESRQLAVLLANRPQEFDIAAYNAMVGYGPDRITQRDVERWLSEFE